LNLRAFGQHFFGVNISGIKDAHTAHLLGCRTQAQNKKVPMNTSPKIKIFIVDDHPLMQQALKTSILTEEDMEVVGTAADGAEAIDLIPTLQPQLIIMDLMMPNMDGLTATRSLTQRCPEIPILVLSSLEKEESIFKAVHAGARGYLTKDVQHEELINAIRSVSAGQSYLPAKIMTGLMVGVRQNLATESNAFASLTKREKEMLALLGEGYSNQRICEIMVISESTVRVYLHQIMKKMNFENRREAIVFAVKEGLKE
jgi:two-component system response regulator NreC